MLIDIPDATAPDGVTLPASLDFSVSHEKLISLLYSTYSQIAQAPVGGAVEAAASAVLAFPADVWGAVPVTNSRIALAGNGFNLLARHAAGQVDSGRIKIATLRDASGRAVAIESNQLLRLAKDLKALLVGSTAIATLEESGAAAIAATLRDIQALQR